MLICLEGRNYPIAYGVYIRQNKTLVTRQSTFVQLPLTQDLCGKQLSVSSLRSTIEAAGISVENFPFDDSIRIKFGRVAHVGEPSLVVSEIQTNVLHVFNVSQDGCPYLASTKGG